jgi:tetratricopeptide (TPR) repeat protein
MLCEWNWNAAEREFRRAIDLDPSYLLSLHDYGRLLVITGRFNEAAAAFNRALEADRGWNWLLNGLANAHLKAGRFDEAMRYLDASCGLEALPGCLTRRGMVLAAQGRHQDAIAHYQQSLEKQPHSTWTNGHYGYSLAHLGRRKEAEALITSLSNSPLRQVPEFEIAAIHSGLGSREVALDWLERAHGRRSPTVMYSGVDFRFQSLRGERRFQDLLRKLNLH